MPAMLIRLMDDDLDRFNRAAVKGGFYRISPDRPNRSAWALEVLRTVAADALGEELEPRKSKDASGKKAAKAPHRARTKRAATSRKSAG